ncbi:iron-sulfur cluster-binding sensor, FehydlgC, FeS and PAS domain-containing [Syntrophotalea carbinolica DSM 2380]|uniref:Iron-sulfur cluster-binding sensor, FehydlgC, FeS and PAS domain-containing n=1 Tax=Syntrophotalea carbinolica (strain DSM 2380 / NBRC 103641 / GraBd1) TaxID=338963 RepID=Q3A3I3_SYNC1|nr:[Fe-Fe] hydrogenase large subunit C-terminal domain-containing protein [Syntrophotalea carbinolica]ABA89074.1 iron-sulfur cluster-binding sensor, FehydlgC, FeS and PAS domain-containing [Syntrophotalea carbinolica DSM 2380]
MNPHQPAQPPIYTRETECQDCSKCVRYCPVKAIKVADGQARIVPEKCVACGTCVRVCPANAKRVRDDLDPTKRMLLSSDRVYVSLAPSYVSEFPDIPSTQIIAALRKLGFAGVSETALGAQDVSALVAADLAKGENRLYLSSACPAAVTYIQKYLPDLTDSITTVLSPLLSHCTKLREHFGNDIRIVFIGPCGAKKNEADRHPELLDAVITFADLRQWLEDERIHPGALPTTPEDRFVPETSQEGALYPVEGGMIETIRLQGGCDNVRCITVAGINGIRHVLSGFKPKSLPQPLFMELLACRGGCINGPCAELREGNLDQWQEVIARADVPAAPVHRVPRNDIIETIIDEPLPTRKYNDEQLRQALRLIDKEKIEDELNCGGCGYETCRDFAEAILSGHAEASMCLSYLRRQAQRKANALLHCIPSAIVLVDKDLRVVDCNRQFAELFSDDLAEAYDMCPGLKGAVLEHILPFTKLFKQVFDSGATLQHDALHVDDRIYQVTIFPIEPSQITGGVISDITAHEMPREMIAKRAREVIHKNLKTVQEIACRLGENMADTEILLRSLAEGFSPSQPVDDDSNDKD